ncbi:hypothetical protein K7432_000361 [Basidiobolus ranarum]|uniref:BZIP domain-containing protein n=1 Tax=Basidiobolus ranarum TaxID=34480 RepID=A0ABR2X4V2_9FUNG
MSLAAFPPELSFEPICEDYLSKNMNNTACEPAQFFPTLQGLNTNAPTPEEVEQLSFFDQWLTSDYQGSATQSPEELISSIDDFEIIPYGDFTAMSPESLDAFNMSLIDNSMFSDFPSPANLPQMNFLPEVSADVNLATSCENFMSPTYSHSADLHSPVNIQLPSPIQTPRLSFLPVSVSNEIEAPTKVSSKRGRQSEDSSDIAIKRKRNTDAARKSRQRKVDRISELDKRTSQLQTENNLLNTKVAILESEKKHQRQKELELQIRIQTLENQLSEAHRILTER